MSDTDIEESSTPPSDSRHQNYSLRKNRSNGKPSVDADKTRQVENDQYLRNYHNGRGLLNMRSSLIDSLIQCWMTLRT